jgi:hypothetical protein
MWELTENTKQQRRPRYCRRSVTFGNMKEHYIGEIGSERGELLHFIQHRVP